MSRWRVPLMGLLAWLAVVLVGSTAVWWVIASVGEDLGPEPSATRVVAGAPAPPRASGPSPSGPPGTAGPASPRSTSSPGGTAPGAAVEKGTWSGRGGYVTVRCRGSQAGLVAAQPDPGYAVEVSDRGPARIEVSFVGRTEDDGRRVEVRTTCVDARPSYQVSVGGGGDD